MPADKGADRWLEELFGHVEPGCREVVAQEVSGYVDTISDHRLRRLYLFSEAELRALREGLEMRHEALLAAVSPEERDFMREEGIMLLDDIEALLEDDEEAS